MIESIESRLLLAAPDPEIVAGVLEINGSNDGDIITTRRENGANPALVVTLNGEDFSFPESDFVRVRIFTLDGDDEINAEGIATSIYLSAGRGNDRVTAGQVGGCYRGGPGRDTLRGSAVADYMIGDRGNDTIIGGAGSDRLYGEDGNDSILGGSGDDTIRADDPFDPDGGDDVIRGQRGDDRLTAGPGFDRFRGGDGNDRIFAADSDAPTITGDDLNGGEDDDFAEIDEDDVLVSIERTNPV